MQAVLGRGGQRVTDSGASGEVTPVGLWPSPRKLPSSYPGSVPPHHYLLVDDWVHPLRFDDGAALHLTAEGAWLPVDGLLAERGLPPMAERCGIASYGANRNPGTLTVKMEHYGYRSSGRGRVLPVLRGRLPGAEAVAAGLSSQGYFYADLVLGDPELTAEALEVWVILADPEQVRVLHKSEGVGVDSWYRAVVLPEVQIEQLRRPVRPLGYVTPHALLVPPGMPTPVAFPTVPAVGRRIPELLQPSLWELVLGGWALEELVTDRTGIAPGPDQGANLMKYLNGQWWYRHNTGETPLDAATEIVRAVQSKIAAASRPQLTLERLSVAGAVLGTEAAYSAGPEHGLGPALH
jgi:hypothetical protein